MIVIFDELQVVIPIYYCNSSYSFSLKYIAAVVLCKHSTNYR